LETIETKETIGKINKLIQEFKLVKNTELAYVVFQSVFDINIGNQVTEKAPLLLRLLEVSFITPPIIFSGKQRSRNRHGNPNEPPILPFGTKQTITRV